MRETSALLHTARERNGASSCGALESARMDVSSGEIPEVGKEGKIK